MIRPARLAIVLSAIMILAACASQTPGPTTTGPSAVIPSALVPSASAAPATATAPASASATPAPSPAIAGAIACIGLDVSPCDLILRASLAALPSGHPVIVAAQVLADRVVLFTADASQPFEVTIEAGTGPAPTAHAQRADWNRLESRSKKTHAATPEPFTLVHCGLLYDVDYDGSFWDLTGFAAADVSELINSAEGTIQLIDARTAEFRSSAGFTARLARRDGPTYVSVCS